MKHLAVFVGLCSILIASPYKISEKSNVDYYQKPLSITIPAKEIQMPKEEPVQPEYISVELTGYCNCYKCTQSGKGITASGVRASRGTIAVPTSIKLGSQVFINGKEHRAEDTGGAIIVKNNGTYVFDVWFPTHQQALDFGRVKAKMHVEDGKYYIEY